LIQTQVNGNTKPYLFGHILLSIHTNGRSKILVLSEKKATDTNDWEEVEDKKSIVSYMSAIGAGIKQNIMEITIS